MSATQRVKQGFLRLPTAKKLLLIASFTLMLSAVLPWYDNQNTFGSGETYLGIQGPLFMVGFVVLALGAINFLNMFLPLFGKNFGLKRNSGLLSMILGAQAALLLLVGNTVFLHPEFGTNVSHKATGFGMSVAFISVGSLLIAGWWAKRKEQSGDYEKHEKELEEAEVAAAAMQAIPTPEPEPIQVMHQQPMQSSYRRVQEATHYSEPPRANAYDYEPVRPEPMPTSDVDPLTLDARARYKLMKQRSQQSGHAQNNLWGGGTSKLQGPAYGADRTERRLP